MLSRVTYQHGLDSSLTFLDRLNLFGVAKGLHSSRIEFAFIANHYDEGDSENDRRATYRQVHRSPLGRR